MPKLRKEIVDAKTIESSYFILKSEGPENSAGEAKTIGPLNKSQLNEALHRGFISPEDFVWLPGFDNWKPAQVVFSGFFRSDIGKHVTSKLESAKHRFESHARPAAKLDFFAQLVVAVLLGVLFGSFDLQTYYALLLAPISYWSVAAFALGGRSFGMMQCQFCYVNRAANLPVSSFDLVARGCVSFFMVLCFGIEMSRAKKAGKLWSDKAFDLAVRPYERSKGFFGKPVFQYVSRESSIKQRAAKLSDHDGADLTRTQLSSETFGGYLVSKRQIFTEEKFGGPAKAERAETRAV